MPDLGTMDDLVANWRREIVETRIKLASGRLSRTEERSLWHIVDARERFIGIVSKDFEAEMEKIDREIEDVLRRKQA
ncbi:MAG: hypothetical protein AB1490_03065 [Pseudomonadota bacterium]